MAVDLFFKKAHNSNKKHTGEVIMLELINQIVRNVAKEDLKEYLAQKGIRENSIDWSLTYNLLPLEIEKSLNSHSNRNKKPIIIGDFSRIIKLAKETDRHIGITFLLFSDFKEKFETQEAHLDENNQYKQFLQNLLTNGRLIGGLFFLVSFFINIAQICSDENNARYVALNISHFILGFLTVFFFYKHKGVKE